MAKKKEVETEKKTTSPAKKAPAKKAVASKAVAKKEPVKTATVKKATAKPPAKKTAKELMAIVAEDGGMLVAEARPKRSTKKKTVEQTESIHDLARKAAQYAIEKKATDVHLLDIRQITSMTDFFLIGTGDSDRQVKAIAENVMVNLREKHGQQPWKSEGWETMKWIILDYVDFVVHIFQAEARTYYNLERLWADAPCEVMVDTEIPKRGTRAKKAAMPIEPEDTDTSVPAETKKRKSPSKAKSSKVTIISDFTEVGSSSN